MSFFFIAIAVVIVAFVIQMVVPQARFITQFILLPVSFVFGKVMKALNLVIPDFLTKAVERQLSSRVFPHFTKKWENSEYAMVAGQRDVYAARRWPQASFPELWMTNIPLDLQRSPVIDGRLPDGSPVGELGPRFISKKLVEDAYKKSILTAAKAFPVILLFWFIIMMIPAFGVVNHDRPAFNMSEQEAVLKMDKDIWDKQEITDYIDRQRSYDAVLAGAGKAVSVTVLSSLALAISLIVTILFTILTQFGAWRHYVNSAARSKADIFGYKTKESVVRYKNRFEQRVVEKKVWLNQIKLATTFDDTPLIRIGKATGLMRYRGALSAPDKNADIMISLADMGQGGVLVTGGTGEGKTRTILLPIITQVLALLKKGFNISLFAIDGKGVLFHDIVKLAEKLGLKATVIGCGEGEYGVDLMDGIEPRMVADTITSIVRQSGGGSKSDGFWPDMAADMMKNVAVLARAWELTDGGYARTLENNERIYSFLYLYALASYDDMILEAIKDINDTMRTNRGRFANIDIDELNDSKKHLLNTWIPLVAETKMGIHANVQRALAPFQSSALRKAFASGGAERLTTVEECWGRITAVNVSSIEYGMAGRIVTVMLKTLLMTQARKNEMKDPTFGTKQKMLFVADEYQDLITADTGSGGMSDSNFWNVSRSTGMIGLIATQSITSLEQAVGDKAADNFVLQMRNKIFLRVEDMKTIGLAKDLAGKALRSYVYDNKMYESFEAMTWEVGNPLLWETSTINDSTDPGNYVATAVRPLNFASDASKYSVDLRFIPSPTTGSGQQIHDNSNAVTSAYQSAYWRQEEKESKMMTEGNQKEDVLAVEDIMQMGRLNAYVLIQRAGAGVMDLVELPQ